MRKAEFLIFLHLQPNRISLIKTEVMEMHLLNYHTRILAALFMSSLTACRDGAIDTGLHEAVTETSGGPLALVGYNYTNRDIDSFTVNDDDGGNVHVSGKNSGGGGVVCCAYYNPSDETRKAVVRWQSGGCRFNSSQDSSGQLLYQTHYFYKEATVKIEQGKTARVNYMEVHFLPDDRVQVSVTEEMSAPRLRLEGKRAITEPYEQCPNDKRPGAE